MNQSKTLLLAAALSIGLSTPLLAQQKPADAKQQQVSDEQRQKVILEDLQHRFPKGSVSNDERAPVELRTVIGRLVSQSLTPDQLDKAFTELSRVNRNQLGEVSDAQKKALDEQIKAFSQTYQSKYNKKLDIGKLDLFQNAALLRVVVKDADAIGRLPLRPLAVAADADKSAKQDDTYKGSAAASTFDIHENSKLGLMGLPPGGGVARFLVTAVEESRPAAGEMAGDWRLIVPFNLNGNLIAQNLTQHLRDLVQRKDQWPEKADEAEDLLSRRVLMAYYNIDPAAPKATPKAAK